MYVFGSGDVEGEGVSGYKDWVGVLDQVLMGGVVLYLRESGFSV